MCSLVVSLGGIEHLVQGVFIALYHSEDFVSSLNGLFLGPSQQTAASIEIVHKTQNKPFRKAKCVHRYGLESHDFTGKPFQTQYSVASCQAGLFNILFEYYYGWKKNFLASGWQKINNFIIFW